MIITQKYNYAPLPRIDSIQGRCYQLGNSKLPSITTILSKTKDMTHLNEWKKRVGEQEAMRISTEASTIGTGMHNNIEKYLLGQEMTGTLMQKTLANLIIKQGLVNVNEIWGMEVALYANKLYAGTTDLVGLHDNIPSIIDYKNSKELKKKEWIEDYFLQLSAYALAHNEMFGTDINRGVIMMATRNGIYQEFIIEGDEFNKFSYKWAERLCKYYDIYGFNT